MEVPAFGDEGFGGIVGEGAEGCEVGAGDGDEPAGLVIVWAHDPRTSQKCLMVTEASPKASDSRSDALSCSRCSRM